METPNVIRYSPSDLSSPEFKAEVQATLDGSGLVVMRGSAPMIPSHQSIVSSWFGRPHMPLQGDSAASAEGFPAVQMIRNRPRSAQALRAPSTSHFHMDRSFLPDAPSTSILTMQQLPESGGNTFFCDTAMLHRELLANGMQPEGLRVVHEYSHYLRHHAGLAGDERNAKIARAQELRPPVSHSLVQVNPRSGIASLYLSELYAYAVVSEAGGEYPELLPYLLQRAADSTAIYEHVWGPTDVVIMDNARALHRATPCEGDRQLNRTVCGVLSTPGFVLSESQRQALSQPDSNFGSKIEL